MVIESDHRPPQAADRCSLLLVRNSLSIGQLFGIVERNVPTFKGDAPRVTLLALSGVAMADIATSGELSVIDVDQVSGLLSVVAQLCTFGLEIPHLPNTQVLKHPSHGSNIILLAMCRWLSRC
jgi:hypothetical protein